MNFNSFQFWIFLAVVLLAYRQLSHRGQNLLLLAASYYFYGCWDWRFLSLIAVSTVIDYVAALKIADAPQGSATRRYWLYVSLICNLGLLAFFKYYNFFSDSLHSLLVAWGVPVSPWTLNIILPVGISFYTFQTLSYTIDVARGVTEPTRRFLDFALYVSFFPQLVAGPIERSDNLLPQVINERPTRPADFAEGMYHVLLGLFKKIVIADNMAVYVNSVYNDPGTVTGSEALVATYAFAFQIYGDFSGYSSIAQGVAKWMGVDLMFNFRMPYLAITPSDFWQRWHISLSTWLRDYLYIPLGGNRHGNLMTYRNLLLTMVLGGLWHGAAWTFVIWGVFHGLILCMYRPIELKVRLAAERSIYVRVIAALVMFHLVCIGWLFFRAASLNQANALLDAMCYRFEWTPYTTLGVSWILFYCLPLFVFEMWIEKRNDLLAPLRIHWLSRTVIYAYLVLMMLFFPPVTSNVFIYFQF